MFRQIIVWQFIPTWDNFNNKNYLIRDRDEDVDK